MYIGPENQTVVERWFLALPSGLLGLAVILLPSPSPPKHAHMHTHSRTNVCVHMLSVPHSDDFHLEKYSPGKTVIEMNTSEPCFGFLFDVFGVSPEEVPKKWQFQQAYPLPGPFVFFCLFDTYV